MDEATRLLILALIEAAEEIDREEYEQALKERGAARGVDDALNETVQRRKVLIAKMKRLLESE